LRLAVRIGPNLADPIRRCADIEKDQKVRDMEIGTKGEAMIAALSFLAT